MPGILPGSANQCILGNLFLRYILSTKCIAQCTLAVQHAFTNEDAISQCVHLQSYVLDLGSGSHADVAFSAAATCYITKWDTQSGYSIRVHALFIARAPTRVQVT